MTLSDPRLFNYLAVAVFLLAAVRFAVEGRWVDSLYWLLGAGINALITWGYQ